MHTRPVPFVKVCCIASSAEALLAVQAGASAIGLVSAMPSGPGVIADEEIAWIARGVPPPVATFLLTSRTSAASIVEQHERCRTSVLQLVDHVPTAELRALRACAPGVKLVQVIHVTGRASIDEALAVEPFVDALLLDSGNPHLAVKELGGTGRVHDWATSRAIREAVSLPVFLAGGLTAHNVQAAIEAVSPFGIDLCSHVRTDGRLDPHLLARFMSAVRAHTGRLAWSGERDAD